MRAGWLRNKVQVEREMQTPDGAGGVSVEWQVIAAIRGELRMSKGKEVVSSGQIEASAMGTVSLRYSTVTASITEADRVVVDGIPMNIRSVRDPEGRKRRIELIVERGVAQ
ncbi:phage head closure protein [Pseudovibrio exalbescens]|uniref:phage head closure protein n=1 Tax=Pseudovibrio exalbescens TaxID=197461 RepID=UPI000C9C93D0|nr:phage head closure protein [Pseudovibrio exalbescens]